MRTHAAHSFCSGSFGHCLVCLFAYASHAYGAVVTLEAYSRGQLDETGRVLSASPTADYGVGNIGATVFRNYFVFDLGGVDSEITGGQLWLFNPPAGYASNSTLESLSFFDAETDSSGALKALGSSGFGGRNYTFQSQGTFSQIDLGGKFVLSANRTTHNIALWGRLSSLDSSLLTAEHVFHGSGGTPASNARLVLTIVPEPSLWITFTLAALALASTRQASRTWQPGMTSTSRETPTGT